MKKNIVIGVILILVILLGLISTKYFFSRKRISISPKKEQKITLPKILYNLTGIIQKLEKDSLTFEATMPQVDEKGQPVEKTEIRKYY